MIDRRIRQLIFALISMGVGLAVSVAFVEVALRIIDWPSPGLYQDGVGPLPLAIATEDGSSWRRYPGVARLRHWDYDVDIRLNDHGFIERPNAPKEEGTWRIGLFGDSFTAGMGVQPNERFGSVWERSLPAEARASMEVYNFGSAWSGTGQSAAFLAKHGSEYRLDEVILALFSGNELQDNEHWEAYRSLPPEAQKQREQKRRSWRDRLRNRSRAAGFLYVSVVRGFASRKITVPNAEFVSEKWPPTERALADFVDAADGRPLTIWYLPSTTEWDDALWSSLRDELGLNDSDRHAVRDRIRRWANENGVPFVDTTHFLEGRTAREIRFQRDGHWNPAGHLLVGRALAAERGASHWQSQSRNGTRKP